MERSLLIIILIILMVAIIVSVDILIFRHYFYERLIANIGIVMVFMAFAFRYFKR